MNNYDLIEVIGEGTYGIVYKCRDKRTNRIVAVKQFKDFQTNAYVRCTMLRELRVEQLLRGKPNVTQLLEAFKQQNRLYLVMEYIPRSLLNVLEEHHNGLVEDSLIVLLYTLLLGVQSCHRSGIIHRDIKPENILVRSNGTASLCDFGFCRPVLQQQKQLQQPQPLSWLSSPSSSPIQVAKSSQVMGSGSEKTPGSRGLTPSSGSTAASAFLSELVLADHRGAMTDYVATRWYRSPEMLLGMPNYSYAVDMWAVGAIMAEAIDGEPLLPGKTELEQLSLIQTRVGEFPATYEAAVRKRNGGMLRLRSSNQLAKQQARGRVRLGSGDVSNTDSSMNIQSGCSERSGNDCETISSYLSMRYGGRIKKEGMQLLTRLLCVDADGRPTVEEALAHPYFDCLRHDPHFATQATTSLVAREDVSSDEKDEGKCRGDGEERETSLMLLTRQTTSSTVDTVTSAGPLPPLSPTLRSPNAMLFLPSTPHNSLPRGSTEKSTANNAIGSGATLLFQRTERGKNTGRPPRATDADAHAAANDIDANVSGFAMDVSLPSPGSSSAWRSATTSPRLAVLPQQLDGPLPSLNGKEASSVLTSTADAYLSKGDDVDAYSNLDDNSPPPRPVLRQAAPGSNSRNCSPLQRRHAASEGTIGSTLPTTTTTVTSTTSQKISKAENSFARSNNQVSTLFFKTKKGRTAIDSVLGNRRSSQSEESAAGASTSASAVSTNLVAATPAGSSCTSRFAHGMTGVGGALAPLRRRSSNGGAEALMSDTDDEQAHSTSRHAPRPLPLHTNGSTTASSSTVKSLKNKPKGHCVVQSENNYLCKATAGHEEEADAFMSAPRSGGERRPPAEINSAHKRTSSYTVHRTQGTAPASKKAKKNAKKALRPGLHQSHKSTLSSQSDSQASSSNNIGSLQKQQVSEEPTAPAAAMEWQSTKRRGASPPQRTPVQRAARSAMIPVSARSPARKHASQRNAARQASPDNSTVVAETGRKKTGGATSASSATPTGAAERGTRPESDRSRFTSPKLPRKVKPLQPRELMTLLKEIESLGCPVETPSAVEVIVPVRLSPPVKDGDDSDNDNKERLDANKIGSANGSTTSPAASSASSTPALDTEAILGTAGLSQLTADSDELFVEDLDCDNGSVSWSPLLGEATGRENAPLSPSTPPLAAFGAYDGSIGGETSEPTINAATRQTTTAATRGLFRRVDYDYPTTPTTSANNTKTNSNSNRAQPSLYFRSSRTAPTPLKLAAMYVAQGNGPPQLFAGVSGNNGGSTSTDGTSSPAAHLTGAPTYMAVQSQASSISLSPSFGRRPTPTLLRHPQSKQSTSQPSPPTLPFNLPNGVVGGGGDNSGVLRPLNSSHRLNSSSPRTPRDDSPRVPMTSSVPFHKISNAYLAEKPLGSQQQQQSQHPSRQEHHQLQLSEDAAVAELWSVSQQRRLSANNIGLSFSGDFTHAGSLALSRRSQERMPCPNNTNTNVAPAAAASTPPTANADDVETELLMETPPASPYATDRRGISSIVATPSPPYSGTTAAMSSCTTRATSASTLRRSISREAAAAISSSALRHESSNRPSTAASLSPIRTSTHLRSSPLTRRLLGVRREDDEYHNNDNSNNNNSKSGEELPGGAQTISFPLPSFGDRSGSLGESNNPSSRDVEPLSSHPPHPVLGGVWVNVDASKNGQPLHAAPSRRKSRLIL